MSASIVRLYDLDIIEQPDPFTIPAPPRPVPPPLPESPRVAAAVGLLVGAAVGVGISAVVFLG